MIDEKDSLFYYDNKQVRMEFDPIDHLICSLTNKRKTSLQEIIKTANENPDMIINLINYGISKNILTEIRENSDTFYTLTQYGEEQLKIMSSKIIDGWNTIIKAVQSKDIDTFVKMVKENENWIKYLRYTKMIPTEDADFVLNSYKEIIKSRQKKKTSSDVSRLQTDAEIERTRVLTEQQWKFDDQNYEITREYNEYVDTNYYDNNY